MAETNEGEREPSLNPRCAWSHLRDTHAPRNASHRSSATRTLSAQTRSAERAPGLLAALLCRQRRESADSRAVWHEGA